MGFWIRDDMIHKCTLIEPKATHADIAWLQVISRNGPAYVAITYSRPSTSDRDHTDNHIAITTSLKKAVVELSKTGQVIVLGDLNSRLSELTGDRKNLTHGAYEKHTLNLMQSCLLKNANNPKQHT